MRGMTYGDFVTYLYNSCEPIDVTYASQHGYSAANSVTIDQTNGVVVVKDSSNNVLGNIAYDWTFKDNSGTLTAAVFEDYGKYHVKVLNALGYAIPQGVSFKTTDTWYTTF